MKSIALTIAVVMLAGTVVLADQPSSPTLTRTETGFYIVTPRPATSTVPGSSLSSSVATRDGKLFFRLAAISRPAQTERSTETLLAAIQARHNNIAALAVNTQGVSRATRAVKRDGRVFLTAGGSSGGGMDIARNDK